jgi:hypothetical protein
VVNWVSAYVTLGSGMAVANLSHRGWYSGSVQMPALKTDLMGGQGASSLHSQRLSHLHEVYHSFKRGGYLNKDFLDAL